MDFQPNFSNDSYQSLLGSPLSFDEPEMVEDTQAGVYSSQPAVVPPTRSKKSKSKKTSVGDATKTRGPTFNNDEDICLSEAWLEASEDPITGTLQGRNTFWNRVARCYALRNSVGIERDDKSLSQHWQKINPKIQKFCGCFAQVENRAGNSGNSDMDKIQKALLIYTASNSTEAHKEMFVHLGAWNILRYHCKWAGWMNKTFNPTTITTGRKKTKTNVGGSSSASDPEFPIDISEETERMSQSDTTRPIGRKEAKKRSTLGESSSSLGVKELLENISDLKQKRSDGIEKKNEIMARRVALDEERWAYEKQQMEFTKLTSLLNQNTSHMDPVQLQLFHRLQEDTFKNMGINPNF